MGSFKNSFRVDTPKVFLFGPFSLLRLREKTGERFSSLYQPTSLERGKITMNMFLRWIQVDPVLWAALGAAFLIATIIAFKLAARAKTRLRSIFTVLGMVGGVIVIGGGFAMHRLKEIRPRPLEGSQSRADPPGVVQEGLVESAAAVRRITNKTEQTPEGGWKYVTDWSPEKGFQLVAENCDLKDLVGALGYPLRVMDVEYAQNPQQGGELLERVRKSAPEISLSGKHPLMQTRFRHILAIGKREGISGLSEEEPVFLVWVNDDGPDTVPARVKKLKIPYQTAVNFDCMMVWYSNYFGVPLYPHVVRWCKQALEAEGKGFFASPPGFEKRYQNPNFEREGKPENLSLLGLRIDEALCSSGRLPQEIFGMYSDVLEKGRQGTPYQGRGFAHNVAAVLWGEELQSTFNGDHVLALRVAAFLALNTRARLKDDPKEDYQQEAHANRRYCANVANHWMKLEGFQPFPKAFGEEDPSFGMLKFLQHYAIEALPLNGNYKLKTGAEMDKEGRARRYLGSNPGTLQALIDAGYLARL